MHENKEKNLLTSSGVSKHAFLMSVLDESSTQYACWSFPLDL